MKVYSLHLPILHKGGILVNATSKTNAFSSGTNTENSTKSATAAPKRGRNWDNPSVKLLELKDFFAEKNSTMP